MLDYAGLITRGAYRSTHEDVEKLRKAGWKEEQIAEAVYVIAMFAFFKADAVRYKRKGQQTPPKILRHDLQQLHLLRVNRVIQHPPDNICTFKQSCIRRHSGTKTAELLC
jgi:hypothetical protein